MVRVTQCSQVPETGTFAVLEVRDIVLEVELNGPNLDSGYFREQNYRLDVQKGLGFGRVISPLI